jgi:glutamine amidotransferase
MIAIVNYGMGNLRSVQKALEHLGATTHITSDPADLHTAGRRRAAWRGGVRRGDATPQRRGADPCPATRR